MPRSVLTVDVDDTKFQSYLKQFQEYRDQLSKMSGFWTNANEAAEGASASSGSMVEALAAGAASTALITDAMERTSTSTARAASSMGTIADHAKSAAGYIVGATERLAKWAVLSLGAGLIGGGVGLWGLDRLGETVAGTRREAQGLGISAGELQAFNVNFGQRLGLGTDFLSNVQNIRSDLSQQWQLQALGIPQDRIQNEDAADLTTDVIRRAHDLWQQAGPAGHNQQWMQAHGLQGIMSFSQWQQIGAQSNSDLNSWISQYQRDRQSLNVSDPTQKAWTDFVTQLERAGKQIDMVFVKALQPIIDSGALPKLSAAVEHLVEKFFGNPNVIKWIDDFAGIISKFGDYLNSEKFGADLKSFVDNVSYAAQKMVSFAKVLGLLPDAPTTTPEPSTTPGGIPLFPPNSPFHWINPGLLPGPRATGGNASDPANPSIFQGPQSWSQWFNMTQRNMDFAPLEKVYSLPPGLLKAVGWEESHLNPNVADSPAGAQGMFQFMPGTQKRYNINNPRDPDQEANAAGMYLRDLLIEFHGDIEKALAGYNWGEKNVERDVVAHGDQWMQFAPRETQKYVRDILNNTKINVQVSVTNQTGANVAVTANAVRQ